MLALTNVGERSNGRMCHWYDACGKRVLVCDSALNVLLIIEMFADESLPESMKSQLLPLMLFAEPEKALDGVVDLTALFSEILWDACGLDVTGERGDHEKIFDWEEDAERIVASLRMAYGIDWSSECGEISFKEVLNLLGALIETRQSTPFGEAIYYRSAELPKPNKYNTEERESFRKMREHFALKSSPDYKPEKEASALFDRIWEEVNNG